MYICIGQGVTERHIQKAVDGGARQLQDLRTSLKVATKCGRCATCARQSLRKTLFAKFMLYLRRKTLVHIG